MFDRYIAFQARQRPRASAIITQRGDISFAQFAEEIAAVAQWAKGLGLARERVVVVRIADRYLHWLALLALARLGVPSASVIETASVTDIQRFLPQALITDRDDLTAAVSAICPVVELTVTIARQAISGGDRLWSGDRVEREALARVSASSGTTGEPKLLGLSWSDIEIRVTSSLRVGGNRGRMLGLVGPDTGSYEGGLAVWLTGAPAVFGPRSSNELAAVLTQLAPETLAGAPIQVQMLIKALPEGFLPLPSMRIALFGAHTPTELRREISARLSSDIYNIYGTTEAGLMAWAASSRLTEATAVGFVPPWVDLEIVDEEDRPCTADVSGALRVRGPVVARGYLNDPVASATHFRDGWFYPGDTGLMASDGLLHLLGRTNEVINLGGSKVLPLAIEEAARACPAVTDAAAFMAPGKDGVEGPWVAVVSSSAFEQAHLLDRLVKVGAVGVNLLSVRQIPRNARGKIMREALRREVTDAQSRAGAPAPPGVITLSRN